MLCSCASHHKDQSSYVAQAIMITVVHQGAGQECQFDCVTVTTRTPVARTPNDCFDGRQLYA